MLICPYCGEPLARVGGVFCCEQGHSFDVAREGYVNLAVGRHPGDTKAMLLARRAFLDAGYYAPLAAAIIERITAHLRQRAAQNCYDANAPAILDVGSGEGYYTGHLAAHLRQADSPLGTAHLFGLDIARDGVRMAARRYPEVAFVVANIKAGLPLRTASLEVVLNIFAPRNPAEFARVLAAGGLLLIVIPQPDHLAELRAKWPLLTIEAQKREHILDQFASAFTLQEAIDLRFEMSLTAAAVTHLLLMTPTHYESELSAKHAGPAPQATLAPPAAMTVMAAFTLLALTAKATAH